MKKLIILALAAVMFTGCEQNLPNSSDITTTTVSSESTTSEETTTEITTTEITSDTTGTDVITTQPTPALTTAPATAVPPVTTKAITIAPPVTTVPLPAATTAPPATTAPNDGSLSFQQQVVNLVNAERVKAGLSQLSISIETERAAQIRASEIIINMSHTRPNGTSCFTALDGEGVKYTASGENIAGGQATPADVMKSWMNSAGHKANILNSTFTHIGIGYAEGGNYRINWVQMFVRLA